MEKVSLLSFKVPSSYECSRPRGSHLPRDLTYLPYHACIIHSSLPTHSYLHRDMLVSHISAKASFNSSSLGAIFSLLFQSKQLWYLHFLTSLPLLAYVQSQSPGFSSSLLVTSLTCWILFYGTFEDLLSLLQRPFFLWIFSFPPDYLIYSHGFKYHL